MADRGRERIRTSPVFPMNSRSTRRGRNHQAFTVGRQPIAQQSFCRFQMGHRQTLPRRRKTRRTLRNCSPIRSVTFREAARAEGPCRLFSAVITPTPRRHPTASNGARPGSELPAYSAAFVVVKSYVNGVVPAKRVAARVVRLPRERLGLPGGFHVSNLMSHEHCRGLTVIMVASGRRRPMALSGVASQTKSLMAPSLYLVDGLCPGL